METLTKILLRNDATCLNVGRGVAASVSSPSAGGRTISARDRELAIESLTGGSVRSREPAMSAGVVGQVVVDEVMTDFTETGKLLRRNDAQLLDHYGPARSTLSLVLELRRIASSISPPCSPRKVQIYSLADLNEGLLAHVLYQANLDTRSKCQLSCVSPKWRRVLSRPSFWENVDFSYKSFISYPDLVEHLAARCGGYGGIDVGAISEGERPVKRLTLSLPPPPPPSTLAPTSSYIRRQHELLFPGVEQFLARFGSSLKELVVKGHASTSLWLAIARYCRLLGSVTYYMHNKGASGMAVDAAIGPIALGALVSGCPGIRDFNIVGRSDEDDAMGDCQLGGVARVQTKLPRYPSSSLHTQPSFFSGLHVSDQGLQDIIRWGWKESTAASEDGHDLRKRRKAVESFRGDSDELNEDNFNETSQHLEGGSEFFFEFGTAGAMSGGASSCVSLGGRAANGTNGVPIAGGGAAVAKALRGTGITEGFASPGGFLTGGGMASVGMKTESKMWRSNAGMLDRAKTGVVIFTQPTLPMIKVEQSSPRAPARLPQAPASFQPPTPHHNQANPRELDDLIGCLRDLCRRQNN